jgi:hypothetical protein
MVHMRAPHVQAVAFETGTQQFRGGDPVWCDCGRSVHPERQSLVPPLMTWWGACARRGARRSQPRPARDLTRPQLHRTAQPRPGFRCCCRRVHRYGPDDRAEVLTRVGKFLTGFVAEPLLAQGRSGTGAMAGNLEAWVAPPERPLNSRRGKPAAREADRSCMPDASAQ